MKRCCIIYGGGIARIGTMGAKRFVRRSVSKCIRKTEENRNKERLEEKFDADGSGLVVNVHVLIVVIIVVVVVLL